MIYVETTRNRVGETTAVAGTAACSGSVVTSDVDTCMAYTPVSMVNKRSSDPRDKLIQHVVGCVRENRNTVVCVNNRMNKQHTLDVVYRLIILWDVVA
jgi:hypothetical protein